MWFSGRVEAYFYSPLVIWRVFREFKPDIVHVEQEAFSLSAFQLALFGRFFGKGLTLFVWENVDRKFPFLRNLTTRLVTRPCRFLFAGNTEAIHLCRQWGHRGPSLVVPQLGVKVSVFRPRHERSASGAFVIGYAGQLVPEKGVDLLLHAGRVLKEKGYPVKLVVVGGGPAEAHLRDLALRMGLGEVVTWRGWVPHAAVPDEMVQMDVLVLPSRSMAYWKEQFGHVLIEAMATGTPVVGSSCGAIPDVIGRPDLIFPEGNFEGLTAILERLIQDRDRYKEVKNMG